MRLVDQSGPENCGTLEIFPQRHQHDEAAIEGDARALRVLADCLRRALTDSAAQCGKFVGDMGHFDVSIVVNRSLLGSRRWRRARLPYTDPAAHPFRSERRSLSPAEQLQLVLSGTDGGLLLTVGNLLWVFTGVGLFRHATLNIHAIDPNTREGWIVASDVGCSEPIRCVEQALNAGKARSDFAASDDEGFELTVRCTSGP